MWLPDHSSLLGLLNVTAHEAVLGFRGRRHPVVIQIEFLRSLEVIGLMQVAKQRRVRFVKLLDWACVSRSDAQIFSIYQV